MKVDFVFFLRHLTNIDVLQKGWNYISLRLIGRAPLHANLVEEKAFPLELALDRRDPQRFFDQGRKTYRFDPETCTLHLPAVRIEYFDQIVMLNKVFRLELETDENQLLLEFRVNFKHYPVQVDANAPPLEECKTAYTQTWVLRHLDVPCIQPVVEVFKDIHLAALETALVWCGQSVEQRRLFREIYGDQSFGDACTQMECARSLRQLLAQAIVQRMNQTAQKTSIESLNEAEIQTARRRAADSEAEKLTVKLSRRIATQEESKGNTGCNSEKESQSNSRMPRAGALAEGLVEADQSEEQEKLSDKKEPGSVETGEDDQLERTANALVKTVDLDASTSEEVMDDNVMVKQTGEIIPDTLEAESEGTDDLDSKECAEELQGTQELNLSGVLSEDQQENDAVRMRFETQAIRRVMIVESRALGFSNFFSLNQLPASSADSLRDANEDLKRYSPDQLDFLLEMQQRQRHALDIIKAYSAVEQESRQPDSKGLTVFVMVHGYKGSQHDFRLLRDLIQMQYNLLQKPVLFVQLDYYQAEDTRVFSLGAEAMGQLRRKLITSMATGSWERTLKLIKEINFVGFSLGNVVVEALLASQPLDMEEVEGMEAFLKSLSQASEAEKVNLMQRQYKPHGSILGKLGRLYCLNGPLLGQTATNSLVGLGMGFLKTVGKGKVNACIKDLENVPIPREELQSFQNLWFVKQMLEFRAEATRPQGMCTQDAAGAHGFLRAAPLDLLAFCSRLSAFKNIICVGSNGDGYVNVASALLQKTVASQEFILSKYQGISVELLCLCHDQQKFCDAPKLDRATGRAVHLCPLLDLDVCQSVADLILGTTLQAQADPVLEGPV